MSERARTVALRIIAAAISPAAFDGAVDMTRGYREAVQAQAIELARLCLEKLRGAGVALCDAPGAEPVPTGDQGRGIWLAMAHRAGLRLPLGMRLRGARR